MTRTEKVVGVVCAVLFTIMVGTCVARVGGDVLRPLTPEEREQAKRDGIAIREQANAFMREGCMGLECAQHPRVALAYCSCVVGAGNVARFTCQVDHCYGLNVTKPDPTLAEQLSR